MKIIVKKLLIGLFVVVSLNVGASSPSSAAASSGLPEVYIFTPNILSGVESVDSKIAFFKPDEACLYDSPVYAYIPERRVFIKHRQEHVSIDVYQYKNNKLDMSKARASSAADVAFSDKMSIIIISDSMENLGHIALLDDSTGSRPKESKLAMKSSGAKDKHGDDIFVELRDFSKEEAAVFEKNSKRQITSLFKYRGGRTSPTAMLAEISASVGGKYIGDGRQPCIHALKAGECCYVCFYKRDKQVANAVGQVRSEQLTAMARMAAGGAGEPREKLE